MQTKELAYIPARSQSQCVCMLSQTHTQEDSWVWLPVVQTDTWLQYQRLFPVDLRQLIRSIKSYCEC